MMFKLYAHLLIPASIIAIAPGAAFAQFGQQGRTTDPNMGHFYMARQQITITDDGPVINNKTTQPGAPGAGSMPAGIPQGLPAARWTQYSPAAENPNLSTSLPKVSNGVPPKLPPGGPAGKSAKAGKLAVPSAKPTAAVKPAPSTEAYAPYKKFAPDAAVTGASNAQSSSAVRGDVLHWARNGR
ncbi:MAG TPA: hypothetical protein V6C97_15470 [Oculatellaceae cyanobacterium]